MSKVIDETWITGADTQGSFVFHCDWRSRTDPAVACVYGSAEESAARAVLLAAAPEMARLLRHIAECGSDGQHAKILAILTKAGAK